MRCGAHARRPQARHAPRRRAGRTRAIAQRAPAWLTVAVRAESARAERSPRHRFDCVQNSESARALQDTVPCRTGRELHPHIGARFGGKEYRRARARRHGPPAVEGGGKAVKGGGRTARCDMGAQGAGSRQTGSERRRKAGRKAGSEAASEPECDTQRGREPATPGPARTAAGARRGAGAGERGVHGTRGTSRNRGRPRSVRQCHREPLPCDLLYVCR